jgi:hypothetical protein
MTESEWFATADPDPMLGFLLGKASDRKFRLFAVACCRRNSGQQTKQDLQALDVAERYADKLSSERERREAAKSEFVSGSVKLTLSVVMSEVVRHRGLTTPGLCAEEAAKCKAQHELPFPTPADGSVHYLRAVESIVRSSRWYHVLAEERIQQCRLVRDIFGNPFRPVALDSSWQTSDVIAHARGIYDDRAFDRLPILADALIDAGCDNEDILAHCRSEGPHVRGCWVVDLVLGKS